MKWLYESLWVESIIDPWGVESSVTVIVLVSSRLTRGFSIKYENFWALQKQHLLKRTGKMEYLLRIQKNGGWKKASWPNSDAIEEMQIAEDSWKRSASDVSQLSTVSWQPSPSKVLHRGQLWCAVINGNNLVWPTSIYFEKSWELSVRWMLIVIRSQRTFLIWNRTPCTI